MSKIRTLRDYIKKLETEGYFTPEKIAKLNEKKKRLEKLEKEYNVKCDGVWNDE